MFYKYHVATFVAWSYNDYKTALEQYQAKINIIA